MTGRTGVVCENCGQQAPGGGKYCGGCGARLPPVKGSNTVGGAARATNEADAPDPATAHVPLEIFETGRYPDSWRVCAATGKPADGLYRIRADKPPLWIWFLLLLGIVPFLLVRLIAYRPVRGWVPVSERAEAEDVRRQHGNRPIAAVVILVLAVLLYGSPYRLWALALLVLAVVVLAVAWGVAGRGRAGELLPGEVPPQWHVAWGVAGRGRAGRTGPGAVPLSKIRATVLANRTLVEIRNVHPAFADAVAITDLVVHPVPTAPIPPPDGQQPPPGWWWDGTRWQPPGRVGGPPD